MKRQPYLDGLRGVAAVLVAIHHFFQYFDYGLETGLKQMSYYGWEPLFTYTPLVIFLQGNLDVEIFFVLSGYVLLSSGLQNKTFLGAIIRRYLRLMLPVLASCLFAWALLQLKIDFSAKTIALLKTTHDSGLISPVKSQLGTALSTGLFGALFDQSSIFPILWTIPNEFTGSILILFLAGVYRYRPNVFYPAAFVITLLSWSYYVFFLLTGMWLFLFREEIAKLQLSRWVSWSLIVFATLLAMFPADWTDPRIVHVFLFKPLDFEIKPFIDISHQSLLYFQSLPLTGFWHGVSAALILFLVSRDPKAIKLFEGFSLLGKLSFPVYLVHLPLLFGTSFVYVFMFKHVQNFLIALVSDFIVYGMLVSGVSYLFYLYIERPTLQFSRQTGAGIDAWLEEKSRTASA